MFGTLKSLLRTCLGVQTPTHWVFGCLGLHEQSPAWNLYEYFSQKVIPNPVVKLVATIHQNFLTESFKGRLEGCTPNVRVPMVFIVFNLGILGGKKIHKYPRVKKGLTTHHFSPYVGIGGPPPLIANPDDHPLLIPIILGKKNGTSDPT